MRIPDFDEPEPDVSVARGSRDDYRDRIAEAADVVLAVEVSDTTLDRDQGPKWLAYAKGRIPVYWIVNLVDGQVEVYTGPGPDGYATCQVFVPGQEIPVVIEGVVVGQIAAAGILPDREEIVQYRPGDQSGIALFGGLANNAASIQARHPARRNAADGRP